jgi:SAM-dependent methyltransferase
MASAHCYRDYYESTGHGDSLSPREQERIASVLGKIPADVHTILELGCGDGRIASRLSNGRLVVGTDLSFRGLQSCSDQFKRVQSDIGQLPFADRSFDLVLCCEVLEHLPAAVFTAALREMDRLAKKYVLLSVPYLENLREGSVRCPACGRPFHVYGHLRNFDDACFARLLPGFATPVIWKYGPISHWLAPLRWLRRFPNGGGRCLHCNAESQQTELSLDQKVVNWAHSNLVAPWHRKPYWIGGVFHRM